MGSSIKHDSARRLRLVGVDDDGDELVLSNSDGDEFYLPITDALRNAAMRPIGRPSAAAADEAAAELSPREIQAKLRAGATVEELAIHHDMDRERLEVYATPIVAERDWIARQAQELEVAAPQLGNHAYEAVFGDEPALLGEMVEHRLTAMGLDPESLEWDAWRDSDSPLWTISAQFSTKGLADSSIGDPPPALWTYKLQSKHLENANRWAQVLSEFGPADSPVASTSPRGRLSTVTDTPFDIESDGASSASGPYSSGESHEELLDVLNARRGQRLGVDEESDEELAAMITRDEQPTAPLKPKLVVSHDSDEGDEKQSRDTAWTTEVEVAWSDDDAEDPADWDGREVAAGDHHAESQETDSSSDQQLEGQTDAFDDMADDDTREALKKTEQPNRSRRRPTVPSWDEIIFGTRKDT
ncbi:MAG TPA: DUF3071 domain-containing protein [Candidatus Yaniella excrementigallinarum]|nr:DUF3071 domain-containing protein [Candidatus Yaniella excrementigallinarum]